jgi:hypothetical protein
VKLWRADSRSGRRDFIAAMRDAMSVIVGVLGVDDSEAEK